MVARRQRQEEIKCVTAETERKIKTRRNGTKQRNQTEQISGRSLLEYYYTIPLFPSIRNV